MKHLLRLSAFALFIALGAFTLVSISPQLAVAQEGENQNTEETNSENTNEEAEDSQEEDSESPYSYTTQQGDSYTKIARKAVQTYGINNDTDLSQAQIVAAETFLTSEAGSPMISVGESVTLSEDSVKNAVEKAEDLDETQQARWEKYVAFVNFDTNNVGESRQ